MDGPWRPLRASVRRQAARPFGRAPCWAPLADPMAAAGAATAEEQAGANQFDRAGRTLLDVVGRLTDALQEM